MMTDEMKDYVLKLRKYTRENDNAAISLYSRLISEESKNCKLTMAEFTFAFSNAVLFSDYLYWLVMSARECWDGAVNDGWCERALTAEMKAGMNAEVE